MAFAPEVALLSKPQRIARRCVDYQPTKRANGVNLTTPSDFRIQDQRRVTDRLAQLVRKCDIYHGIYFDR